MRTVIRGASVVTVDPEVPDRDCGTVVVEDGRIVDVLDGDRALDGDDVVDATGHALMPGLVNCHMHGRPARALGDGLTLREWHDRYPDNVVRRMRPGDAWLGAVSSCGELLLGGTTTILGMPNFPGEFGRGCEDVGIRACVGAHATDNPAMADSCDSLESNLEAVRSGRIDRVRYWFGFEHQNAASDELVTTMARLAGELDTGMTSHLCEHAGDVERHVERHGIRPIPRYDELGVLSERAVFAHGNWLTDDEIALVAERGAGLVHNPTSNMRMGTGAADVPGWVRAGVRFGLGTDGPLSSFRLDMFEVMRATAMLARITNLDPELFPADQLLEIATIGGARTLGLGATTGSITPGKAADLVLVDLRRAHLAPRTSGAHDNLASLLVFCGTPSDVRHVWVDGTKVVADGDLTTVSEPEIVDRLQDRIGDLSALFDGVLA